MILSYIAGQMIIREKSMNLEYICEQMVRILHGNITCISESGEIEACYGDMAAQCNPLFTDPEFLDRKSVV